MSEPVLYIDPTARYEGIQRTAEAKFRATGKGRYTDGRAEWAEYVATITAARKEEKAYLAANYPAWTDKLQPQRELAKARADYVGATANNGDVQTAANRLQRAQYWLWNTSFVRTGQEIQDGTIDLSDPFQGIRDTITDAKASVARWQKEADAGATVGVSQPDGSSKDVPASVMLAEAQKQLADAQSALADATGAGLEA